MSAMYVLIIFTEIDVVEVEKYGCVGARKDERDKDQRQRFNTKRMWFMKN